MSTVALAPADGELRNRPSRGHGLWRWAAGLSAAAAGGLHVAAAVEHLGAHELVVGFFMLVALVQLGLGAWVVVSIGVGIHQDVRLVAFALLGTVALVGLYLLAHTTDLLVGFQAHEVTAAHHGAIGAPQGHSTETTSPVALDLQPVADREPAGPLGTATVAVEMVTVLALTALLPGRWKSGAVNALLILGDTAWVLWLIGVLG
jgi:hypothetical protein